MSVIPFFPFFKLVQAELKNVVIQYVWMVVFTHEQF